jgi:hypothetical protein
VRPGCTSRTAPRFDGDPRFFAAFARLERSAGTAARRLSTALSTTVLRGDPRRSEKLGLREQIARRARNPSSPVFAPLRCSAAFTPTNPA